MSAWVTITTPVANVYRVASQSGENGGHLFRGVLLNNQAIEKRARTTSEGIAVREMTVEMANMDDAGAAIIPVVTEGIWGSVVQIAVDGVTEVWTGKLKNWSQDGAGKLTFSVVEDVLAPFKKLLPDEVLRTSNYQYLGRSAVNATVPMVFGGTSGAPVRVKAKVVDRRTTGGNTAKYVVCSGEVRQIAKVWKDGVEISTGFTAYVGTAGQALYPGFAYIEFAADPRDTSGRWPDIMVDVVGLKLGTCTEAECRNPARILQYLLTTADTGPCGWGLGVDPAAIDATSFGQAIADCASLGLVVDGALFDQKQASFWINQLLLAGRMALSFEGGLYTLRVDQNTASVKSFTTANMRVTAFGLGPSSDRKNRVIYDYRLDPTSQDFLASAQRDDASGFDGSQDKIGLNEKRDSLYLVADETTANKLADYAIRWEEYSEDQIKFETVDAPAGLRAGQVIDITHSDLCLSGALYRVVFVKATDFGVEIHARSYSSNIFGNDAPVALPSDPPTDPTMQFAGDVSAPPSAPSGLSLATAQEVQPDGTVISIITGQFTSGSGALVVKVEVGEGAAPGSWITLHATIDGAFTFKPAKPGQLYTFRLQSWNAAGASTTITGSVTALGDTSAPGQPQKPTCTTYFKNARVRCWQNASKAADMAGFSVYRAEEVTPGVVPSFPGEPGRVGFVSCAGNDDGVVFIDEGTAYGKTYYYWVKALDTSGNPSSVSPVGDAVTTAPIATGDFSANTISGSIISAGTLNADKIVAGSITGDRITSTGWITGKKFTTADNVGDGSTAGVIFDTAGIRGYNNSSSSPMFSLDASTGKVTARSGYIGNGASGWTIADTALYNGRTSIDNTTAGVYLGTDGFSSGGAGAPTFKVTSGGVVTATSGTVGGWTLGTNDLTTNYGGNCLALDRYNGRICGTSQYDATNAFFFTLKPAEFAVSHWNPSTSGIYSQFGLSFDMSDPGKKALFVQSSVCDALKVYAPSSAARAVMIYGGAETTGTITAGTYVAAGTCVTAGTCVVTGSYVTTSLGPGHYLCLSGHASGYAGGGAHIWLQNNAAKAYINNDETGSVIYLRGYVTASCCITANTCVVANAGAYVAGYDIYAAKQIRAAGWYAGPWGGLAAEMGISGDGGWFMTYDRTNSKYYPSMMQGGAAGGSTSSTYICVNHLGLCGTAAIMAGTCITAPVFNASNTSSTIFQGPNFAINTNGGTSIDFYSCISGSWAIHQQFFNGYTRFAKPVCVCNVFSLDIGASGAGTYHQMCGGNGFGMRFFACGTTTRGYLYADNSYFGLLNSSGSYALVLYNGTSDVYLPGKLCYGSMGQISMRHLKHSFTPVGSVLCQIKCLPIEAWKFNSDERGEWHIGPMAEDWQCAFPWMADGRTVSHVDSIALLGVQQLDARLTDELDAMRRCINDLEKRLPSAA